MFVVSQCVSDSSASRGGRHLQSVAATCSEGFVSCFLIVIQAVRLYSRCHAAQARKRTGCL